MQDLRLVGVHDDGEHLLLSGTGGEIFRLRIDEALRVASTRSPYRSADRSMGSAAADPSVRLSPRDIQGRIRSGATAEQIADESGLDLAHIERYEGPVRAERDYVAEQAQQVHVSSALPTHDGYRSAFGDNPASLAQMVSHRLVAFGLDPATASWDAWRRPDGAWNVVAEFEPSSEAAASIGDQPPAQWTFDAARKTISNGNRWAQLLSELEPMDGPPPARRLAAVADRVFDFEAESAKAAADPTADDIDSDNLLEVLRSRRGQRLGADEHGDDALALLLSHGAVPAAHPRTGSPDDSDGEPENVHDDEPHDDGGSADEGSKDEQSGDSEPVIFPSLSLAPHYSGRDDAPHLHNGVSTRTREISISGAPKLRSAEDPKTTSEPNAPRARRSPSARTRADKAPSAASAPTAPGAGDHGGSGGAAEKGTNTRGKGTEGHKPDGSEEDRKHIKPKRASIPSWDEIVFGTKSE